MRRIAAILFGTVVFAACGNATDGDADTDTTSFPVDTNEYNNPTDSVGHTNSSTGTYHNDSTSPSPDGASKGRPASAQKTTPHNPARIDTLRQ